ncbi:MAG: PilZ domain-containing protein [Myxococcota bacterium]
MSRPPQHDPDRDSDAPPAESPATPRERERRVESEWLHEVHDLLGSERKPRPRRPPQRRRAAVGPRVVVCDEGELDDVCQLLGRLGETPLRLRPADLSELRDWERPSRLLVTPVRVALSENLPLSNGPDASVSIAVADSDAQSQCTAMLRRGFDYVVRRPVHPEALRLLVMQVLWRGREHRGVARFPFGADIRWRQGLHTGRCTMIEISAHGCRLMTRQPFKLGDRIHLRVPAALTGSRSLRLRGRVVRRDRLTSDGGPEPRVAVQFERLSARNVAHLDALLAERASGPAVMGGDPAAGGLRRELGRRRSGFLSLGQSEEPEAAEPPQAQAPDLERRRQPRGAWPHELVSLDRETDRVLHTLLGSDLSVGGVRVEPNPLLRLGDRLRLALYDAGSAEPLVVEARVAHDGGRSGVGLVFLDPPDAIRERLRAMVESLPPVSSLSKDDAKPEGVVLGEIMTTGTLPGAASAAGQDDARQAEHGDGAAEHHDEEAEPARDEPAQD